MRTCAAYIASRPNDAPMPTEHLLDDAADLLIEASNVLEAAPAPLGEPMEIIPPLPEPPPPSAPPPVVGTPQWTGVDLAPSNSPHMAASRRPPHACPKCDSRANKKVVREGNAMMLGCPVCGAKWQWKAERV
jgi:hypothetical protein